LGPAGATGVRPGTGVLHWSATTCWRPDPLACQKPGPWRVEHRCVRMPTALNESAASEPVGSDVGAVGQQKPRLADQISAGSLVLHRYHAAHAPVVWEAIEQSRATLQAWVPEVAGLRTLEQVATG